MPRRRPALLVTLAALAAGCATAGLDRAPTAPPPTGERGARARFEPGAFDVVFREAIRALRARGFDVVSCDPELGTIATAPFETDAACGRTTCLARDTAEVKLGYRRARVVLRREVWDATVRGWRVADDAVSAQGLEREARALVSAAVGDERGGEGDGACAPAPCDAGGCRVASAPRG